ncbi:hypothetical protein BATDEDRAFT_28159 [Batrachochytrium dendrobatidis JAM81]|uniref:EXPERA domain-containing protein n=1 Tax=Batrachochytrium dendrobatidis (strain JAM81 / FGSC 10211) TaxID=684364 RepID=F4PD58_BATDJ|nr:uncharacterized protein BATDEDRAFT_28159 [Batrachochytrium dendrobatidis JAM81]EGF77034.1 hypothetical protein BATDEDRAFT_28159 [Batrachochytrium dendrobatidis JAM81]|eukprot:XP_006682422.1 hypothetical protein BATDEDRAFT_28159 [Batrachochytrium dendrobatidis JAM81]
MAPLSDMIPHPYYPRTLSIPSYSGRTWSPLQILGYRVISVSPHYSSKTKSSKVAQASSAPLGTRLIFLWFLACSGIHFITEGYYVAFNQTIASRNSFMAELWKEYALSDSRYITSDQTIYIWGPLCFIACCMIYKNCSKRHLVLFSISFGQLYGDIIYYATTLAEGAPHCNPHPFYFYFYFIFMNLFWIFIPIIVMMDSGKVIMSALNATHAPEKETRKNK